MQRLSKRIALVTGANKGIGFEVAHQLAGSGCAVLLGARNRIFGEDAAAKLRAEGLDVAYLDVDLDHHATITAAAAAIAARFGYLDILVNNAGIIAPGDGRPTATTLEAIERTLRINFIGTVAVTQAMLPLLRRSLSGRIVNVSSRLGSLTQNGDLNYTYADTKLLGYSASKAALNMLTVQLAYELRESRIKVNSADPGFTATDLTDHRGTQTVSEGAAEVVRLALLFDDGPTGTYSDRQGIIPW